MSGLMEFYTQDRAASMQIDKNVYRRVLIPIDDFNAACDHYGFVKKRTCKLERHGSLANYPEMVCWSCSECHFGWHHSVNDKQFSYCPNCGAKIVARDEVTVYAHDGTKVKTDVYALCSTEFDEIVRCKDCIYYAESPDPVDPGWPMYCEFTLQDMLEPDGFCAWGERREEE